MRRLLAEGVSNNQQADDEVHEGQFLNLLVNSLDEEVTLSLAESAELDAESIYEILVGACAGETSVSTLCERGEDVPHESSVPYHLRIKLDLETLEQVGNMLLQKDILDILSRQVEACVGLHLRPYYGDEDGTDGLHRPQARRGTIALHAYTTLCAHVKNKRYTLAVRRLEDDNTASSVLAEFLGIPNDLDLGAKAVYLSRKFYDSKCLTLLQTHNHAYIISIVRWGRAIKRGLSGGWSRVIQHSLTVKLDGHSWTVEFPIYIDCTYQSGRYDEHGVARHGYAADVPFVDSPRDTQYHYTRHFDIEASYRLSEQSIATTSTQNPVVRLLYVVVSLLLQNVWRCLRWGYVATPRREGRRLWEWSFKEFISMIRRAAWTALAVRRAVPANQPPDNRFHQ